MAPQLLQDKEPNPNLAFEALHNPVPTAPSSLTSLYAHVAALGLEFRFMLSVPCPLPSVPLPGRPQPPHWSACGFSCSFRSILYTAARVIIINLHHLLSCPFALGIRSHKSPGDPAPAYLSNLTLQNFPHLPTPAALAL